MLNRLRAEIASALAALGAPVTAPSAVRLLPSHGLFWGDVALDVAHHLSQQKRVAPQVAATQLQALLRQGSSREFRAERGFLNVQLSDSDVLELYQETFDSLLLSPRSLCDGEVPSHIEVSFPERPLSRCSGLRYLMFPLAHALALREVHPSSTHISVVVGDQCYQITCFADVLVAVRAYLRGDKVLPKALFRRGAAAQLSVPAWIWVCEDLRLRSSLYRNTGLPRAEGASTDSVQVRFSPQEDAGAESGVKWVLGCDRDLLDHMPPEDTELELTHWGSAFLYSLFPVSGREFVLSACDVNSEENVCHRIRQTRERLTPYLVAAPQTFSNASALPPELRNLLVSILLLKESWRSVALGGDVGHFGRVLRELLRRFDHVLNSREIREKVKKEGTGGTELAIKYVFSRIYQALGDVLALVSGGEVLLEHANVSSQESKPLA